PLLLHRLGRDVRPRPEGPQLAQVGAVGHVARRLRDVRGGGGHALPSAHRHVPVDRARRRGRRGRGRHDGAPDPDDGGAAAHGAVALAGRAGRVPRRRLRVLPLPGRLSRVTLTALDFEVVVGGLTFTGSLIAAAKLQELLRGRPITYRGQNLTSLTLLSIIVASGTYLVYTAAATPFFYVMVAMSLVFGLLLVIPIGAADMPVVIALLNSYGGLADAAMGFVLMNKIQIITGSLDGTSGFLLALLMCRAMN